MPDNQINPQDNSTINIPTPQPQGEQQPATYKEIVEASKKKPLHKKVVYSGIAVGVLILVAIGVGTFLNMYKPTTKPQVVTKPPKKEEVVVPKPNITPAEEYEYTEMYELFGIGVKAQFPKKALIYYTNPEIYYITTLNNEFLSFTIYAYKGEDKKAWFKSVFSDNYNNIEAFSANNHIGYIAYKKQPQIKPGEYFFYFTSLDSSRMLLIQGSNLPGSKYFFGSNLDKFKSFLSAMTITTPDVKAALESGADEIQIENLSNQSKTLWQSKLYDLKITAATEIESRPFPLQKPDGTWQYAAWNKILTSFGPAEQKDLGNLKITAHKVNGYWQGNDYIYLPEDKYNNETTKSFMQKTLAPAGLCATGGVEVKSQCAGNKICYTNTEVQNNLILKQAVDIGRFTAELWGINDSFASVNECRASNVWVMKANEGRFIISTFYPKGKGIKIEQI